MSNPWSQTVEAIQPSTKPEWLTLDLQTALINNGYPLDQDGLLMLHKRAKEQLDYWKEEEMTLRKIAAQVLVPEKTEGTNTVELGNGYQAKVNNKYNYRLANDNDVVWSGLERIEKLGNEGKFVAERLVSWSPNFLLTEYRQLQEDAKKGSEFAKAALKEISTFMTITEAAPELKIVEPKPKVKKK